MRPELLQARHAVTPEGFRNNPADIASPLSQTKRRRFLRLQWPVRSIILAEPPPARRNAVDWFKWRSRRPIPIIYRRGKQPFAVPFLEPAVVFDQFSRVVADSRGNAVPRVANGLNGRIVFCHGSNAPAIPG